MANYQKWTHLWHTRAFERLSCLMNESVCNGRRAGNKKKSQRLVAIRLYRHMARARSRMSRSSVQLSHPIFCQLRDQNSIMLHCNRGYLIKMNHTVSYKNQNQHSHGWYDFWNGKSYTERMEKFEDMFGTGFNLTTF